MATIGDVARRAGVSQSTVSYALSGKRPISEETRRRIERAIDELGYRPHAGARALATARTDVIGLMAPLRTGVDVHVIMQFVAGVVTGASRSGYDVLLLTQDEGVLDRVTSSSMVDALVVMDVENDDKRLPALERSRQPAVLIGLPADPHGLSCVDLDFARAGAVAARRLIDAGHRAIALVGSPVEVVSRHTSYAERMTRGFVGACEAAGVTYLVVPTAASAAGAAASVDRVLGMMPEVTALVVHNEVALPHVISRFREAGRGVPEQVSVVAVCPEDVAVSMPVPVTSVDIPAEAIGRIAVEMLTGLMADPARGEVRLVSPRLTERGSVREVSAPSGGTVTGDPAAATP
ncbi:LacI family DNA-binding transcriptional regulator [Litorihabitans aurantiacus]|uniref:LacI family transcriptional regulator n=1 Tax=Litorihabitans aurantiacus TaxID=1930061 RepID=A0AA37XG56_9MICO|nr:LacI family DNA-binding transcriptional regulator [Litorihabitans aurantiacus]GMA32478.1 LacI family transcriptional regulator [Litorihabitans aurantiacus]